MQSLRNLVRRQAASAPALVASIACAAGCDSPQAEASPRLPGNGAGVSASAGSAPALGVGGMGLVIMLDPGGGYPAESGCRPSMVQLAEAGPRPDLAALCAAEREPVPSNGAVRVHLEGDPSGLAQSAFGTLTLAPEVREVVVGTPVIQLVSWSEAQFQEATLSALEPDGEGFAFTLSWPEPGAMVAGDQASVTFRTAFDVTCPGGSRLVNAFTELRLCGGVGGLPLAWASPGDSCAACPHYEQKKR